jgi:hypothetical protein
MHTSCGHTQWSDQLSAICATGMNRMGTAYLPLRSRILRPISNITEVAVTKTLACVSLIALTFSLQPAFAQTGSTPAPAPSPLQNAPAASPAMPGGSDATQTKPKRGHRSRGTAQGTSSTGAPGSTGSSTGN